MVTVAAAASVKRIKMDFNEWLKYGIDNKFVGPMVCETHDGLPLSTKEEEEFWENDPCIWILRVYESPEHAEEVKSNHSPTEYRNIWGKNGS